LGTRGLPRERRRLLGFDEHVCAVMLDGLKRSDRTAELDAQLRVFGSGISARPRASGGLRRRQGPGQPFRQRSGVGKERAWRYVLADHHGTAPGGIELLPFADPDAGGVGVDDGEIGADRQQQHVSETGAKNWPPSPSNVDAVV
jgi:hypothetical protein